MLSKNEISVYRLKTTGMTFNSSVSGDLIIRDTECINFAENEYTGELFLIFTKNEGKKLSSTGGKKINLALPNKKITDLFCELSKIEIKQGERVIVKISDNLSKYDDKMVYRVIGKKES